MEPLMVKALLGIVGGFPTWKTAITYNPKIVLTDTNFYSALHNVGYVGSILTTEELIHRIGEISCTLE